MFRQLVGALLLLAASVTAIPALAAMSAAHPALLQSPDSRPKKVVLLPPQVFVYELSTAGVPSRKTDWEATARSNLSSAAIRLAREAGLFEVIPAPDPDPAVQEQLDAHIGLYDRVADSVFVYGRGEKSAWAHKKNEFDYTIGPGLAFLRKETGADAAMIVLGSDYISSGGRKARHLLSASWSASSCRWDNRSFRPESSISKPATCNGWGSTPARAWIHATPKTSTT